MRKTLTLIAFVLMALGCTAPPTPVSWSGIEKERYLRVNLRPEQTTLYSSNYLVLPVGVKIGEPVRITSFSSAAIKMVTGGIEYTMYPAGGPKFPTDQAGVQTFLAKYFVDSPDAVNVDEMEPQELNGHVRRGEHRIGMSKEQLYASLGPPVQVAGEVPTMNMPLGDILNQDTWIYMHQKIVFVPTSQYLYFVDGKLQRTDP